jgi:hypothetical protein
VESITGPRCKGSLLTMTTYKTRLEVNNNNKQSSLLRNEINYKRKKFYSAGPSFDLFG